MKKKTYRHLNQLDRDRIQSLLDSDCKQKTIAEILAIDKSTVSREIKRNRRKIRTEDGTINGQYQASAAGHKAYARRLYAKYQGKKINENNELKNYIESKLRMFWSPDEIAGRMKRDREPFYASKTAIYEWIFSVWAGSNFLYLYSQRYKVKKRRPKTKRTLIPNRRGLALRPKGANNKTRFGHYEGDTMVSGKKTGSKAGLAVIYERKAKNICLEKINNLKPIVFNQAVKKMTENLTVKSLSFDNGVENVKHQEIGAPTFFCAPYSPWQKAGVENAIKMARRFIPKGKDLSQYSNDYVKIVEHILNNKPRKSLKYQTPYEIMAKHNLFKKVERKTNIFVIKNTEEKIALRG